MLLVLAMVLSMSVTAFAEENTGKITITNATVGQTYKLYRIFDATYSTNAAGNADSVLYTINKDTNPFFAYMFGTDGTADNPYFVYHSGDGVVEKKNEHILDTEIIQYLTNMVRSEEHDFQPLTTQTATNAILEFTGLTYGYYLIDKGTGATVTIDSNTPNVDVIDKNQIPGTGFNKVMKGNDGQWNAESNSASVGDMVEWMVTFEATNYDGDDIVQYYTITDEKSSPLWVEFNTIEVWVNGVQLHKGYYYCANNGIQTNEWEYLGTWGSEDTKAPSNADWYLIHYTYDKFEIVIPWLNNYTFTGKQDLIQGYELTFDFDKNDGNNIYSTSRFVSPVQVEVYYDASVGPESSGNTVRNAATLDWTTAEGESGPETPETTDTKVYNLGVTKIANDGTPDHAATRLAGAVFELYRDEACTQPVYVIPTNNEGVYILDDTDTNVSGYNRKTSREVYENYWEDYINGTTDNPNPNGSGNKRKDMVTPANGQLVIMGLEAGTYYLKETLAPIGYNELPAVQKVTVGPNGTNGIYADPSYKSLAGKAIQFNVSKIEIVNNKGMELPSTGGAGTMMMISVGTMIAIAFAVLLITQKKMSIYRD